MPSSDPRQRLLDILDNIGLAREFSAGFSIDEFAGSRVAFYATTRCLEIISEASRRLSPEIQARHPSVAWRRIAAAGNVYRDDYPTVEPRQVWLTVHDALGALETAARIEFSALPEAEE